MRYLPLVLLLAGCAITNERISRNLSAGVIGCPPEEIQIVNETATIEGTHNWEAHCKGKRFICTFQAGTGTHCTEAL